MCLVTMCFYRVSFTRFLEYWKMDKCNTKNVTYKTAMNTFMSANPRNSKSF